MVNRNLNIVKLQASYLFVEISRRVEAFRNQNQDCSLINLGIGDTTSPLPESVTHALIEAAEALGTKEGYSGYGSSTGIMPLREVIAEKLYSGEVTADEVYVSDGSKCDIGRLQLLFNEDATVAVQDPSYPAYVDSSVIMNRTGNYNENSQQYENIVYMSCTPENNFFPDLDAVPRTDIIYFCSPNNPTGVVPSYEQLQKLVNFALKNRSILIFDTAYASYITDDALPKSIYEIPGARKCAIETGSFSKLAGFTGVRLAWTIVPKELTFNDGTSVSEDWSRIISTFFNGASNIAQQGGLAVLSETGLIAVGKICQAYMENAALLRKTIENAGYQCYGGQHAPYLWIAFPGRKSWDVFDELLTQAQLIVTPGSGFGPAGEGFIRLSALGNKVEVQEAAKRLQTALKKEHKQARGGECHASTNME